MNEMTQKDFESYLARIHPNETEGYFTLYGERGLSVFPEPEIVRYPSPVVFSRLLRFTDSGISNEKLYRIVYQRSGSFSVSVGGSEMSLAPGDFILAAPGVDFSYRAGGLFDTAFSLLIDPEVVTDSFLKTLSRNIPFMSFFTDVGIEGSSAYIKIETGGDEVTYELLSLISRELLSPAVCSRESVVSMLAPLFNSIFHAGISLNRLDIKTVRATGDIQAILDYIVAMCGNVSLNDISTRFGYAPNYISQLLKNEYKLSFIDICHRIKLSRAEFILATSNLSIGETAKRVGFANSAFFTELFKRYSGMTPTAYRKERGRSTEALNPDFL